MVRLLLFVAWSLLLVLFAAYHYGPGQDQLAKDDAGQLVRPAMNLMNDGKFEEAAVHLTSALEKLPKEELQAQFAIQLERNKAWLQSSKLPEAHDDLVTLIETMNETPGTSEELIREANESLAHAKYYITWLMRLEGRSRDEWYPVIETSRQLYLDLAENAKAEGDTKLQSKYQEDLELSIRLARMDLKQLQGLPLPKQCNGCCSGNCKKPGKKPGKKNGKKPKDNRGASAGPPLDNNGS